jgi:hypothetical protein
MREIRTSGSMSGEGKRSDGRKAQATAPFLDSTPTEAVNLSILPVPTQAKSKTYAPKTTKTRKDSHSYDAAGRRHSATAVVVAFLFRASASIALRESFHTFRFGLGFDF